MHVTGRCLIRKVANLVEKRAIRVDFKDGSHGLFPYVWLRDCSLDPKTYTISNSMKGRLHSMRNFDVKVEPMEIQLDERDNCVLINWPGDVSSRYDQWWLKNRCPADEKVREARRRVYLDRECVHLWDRQTIENCLQRFAHKAFMEDDKVLHDFLAAVCVDGIALLEGADQAEGDGVLERVVQRIGILQRNHFGDTFEVFPKADASNMAYATTGELPYHTDFPSLQEPPQLQMLHMRKRAECGGGLSMFVDGFHIAELMARLHPDHFRLLSSIPLEFIEEGFDVHNLLDGSEERFEYDMVARHKTFKMDDQGRVVQVQFGNVMRSWFIDATSDPIQIQRLYDALKMFTALCYAPENQLIFPLENGATVLWANTRLLHARSAYRLLGIPARERRVIGCYFNWDIVKSRIRLCRDKLGLAENQRTI